MRLSHVAVTVPRGLLEGPTRERLLAFWGEVLGWTENAGLSIPGERIFLRAPTDTQYLTIRASDSPMVTSGYEHVGVLVATLAELQQIHARAAAAADSERFPRVELGPIETAYGGVLHTFRVRFLLPLTIELQYLDPQARGDESL